MSADCELEAFFQRMADKVQRPAPRLGRPLSDRTVRGRILTTMADQPQRWYRLAELAQMFQVWTTSVNKAMQLLHLEGSVERQVGHQVRTGPPPFEYRLKKSIDKGK